MEVGTRIEQMEIIAEQPDFLELYADREVTVFGITGRLQDLAGMCPVDLSDPRVTLEAKNEFVVKVANESGIQIASEHENYFTKVVEKHNLERKFSVDTATLGAKPEIKAEVIQNQPSSPSRKTDTKSTTTQESPHNHKLSKTETFAQPDKPAAHPPTEVLVASKAESVSTKVGSIVLAAEVHPIGLENKHADEARLIDETPHVKYLAHELVETSSHMTQAEEVQMDSVKEGLPSQAYEREMLPNMTSAVEDQIYEEFFQQSTDNEEDIGSIINDIFASSDISFPIHESTIANVVNPVAETPPGMITLPEVRPLPPEDSTVDIALWESEFTQVEHMPADSVITTATFEEDANVQKEETGDDITVPIVFYDKFSEILKNIALKEDLSSVVEPVDLHAQAVTETHNIQQKASFTEQFGIDLRSVEMQEDEEFAVDNELGEPNGQLTDVIHPSIEVETISAVTATVAKQLEQCPSDKKEAIAVILQDVMSTIQELNSLETASENESALIEIVTAELETQVITFFEQIGKKDYSATDIKQFIQLLGRSDFQPLLPFTALDHSVDLEHDGTHEVKRHFIHALGNGITDVEHEAKRLLGKVTLFHVVPMIELQLV